MKTEKPLSEKVHGEQTCNGIPYYHVSDVQEAVFRLKKEIDKYGSEGWDIYIHKTAVIDLVDEIFGEVKP